MQQLPQIKAAYDWFFAHWQTELSQAVGANNTLAITALEAKRDTLERGVFVLMFGQFENAVNDKFDVARAARAGNPDWTRRRGWDADALKGDRVPFETRLSMVLDKNLPYYGRVIATYNLRNHCAHGGTTVPVSSIDKLETDLYAWSSALIS